MNPLRYLCICLVANAPMPALAQTCAAPIEIVLPPSASVYTTVGNTCDSSNNLPYLANGAIANHGEDDVYRVAIGLAGVDVAMTPEAGVDLSLFLCRGPCGTYATCTAAVDDGVGAFNWAPIPPLAGEYFIIVGHAGESAPTCGSYTLNITAQFGD
jgi:hypothetical protein